MNGLKVPIGIAVVIVGLVFGLISYIFTSFRSETRAAIDGVVEVNKTQDEKDTQRQTQIASINTKIEGLTKSVDDLTKEVKESKKISEDVNIFLKKILGTQ